MNIAHAPEVVGSTAKIRRLFVALELSKSMWVLAVQPPTVDKVSLFRIPGGGHREVVRAARSGTTPRCRADRVVCLL